MTTTDRPRRRRWSPRRIRALAWTTGIATFATGVGALGAAPMPERAASPSAPQPSRQRVVVRRIIRRVVIVEPATSAPVTYVQAPGVTSGSAGATNAAPAPPPTGGS